LSYREGIPETEPNKANAADRLPLRLICGELRVSNAENLMKDAIL